MFSGGRHSAPRSPNCSENWSQRKACENVQDDLWCRLLFWFPYKFRRWQDYRLCTHLRQSGFCKEIWAEVPTSPGMHRCCIDVHLLCTVVNMHAVFSAQRFLCLHHRTVPEAFCFQAVHSCVCACVIVCWKLVTTMSYKPLGNFTMIQSVGAVGDKYELIRFESEDKRARLQQDQIWWNMQCGRYFLTCLRNKWACINETYHSYSLSGPHGTDDIFKVVGSKVKVTDIIFQKCSFK